MCIEGIIEDDNDEIIEKNNTDPCTALTLFGIFLFFNYYIFYN